MARNNLFIALFASALALLAPSAVHARSLVSVSDARDHMSFSDVVVDTNTSRVSFDLSGSSAADDGKKVFGGRPHATALDGGSVFGWDLDAKVKLNHDAHGPELFGAVDTTKFHGRHGHDVSPVSAIPEPSAYSLLAAGLAGIAIITRRRRRGT